MFHHPYQNYPKTNIGHMHIFFWYPTTITFILSTTLIKYNPQPQKNKNNTKNTTTTDPKPTTTKNTLTKITIKPIKNITETSKVNKPKKNIIIKPTNNNKKYYTPLETQYLSPQIQQQYNLLNTF